MKHYFYKYFTINQNLYSSLINNELYFCNPRNFNDPFDSYPRISLVNAADKLTTFYNFIKSKVKDSESFVNSSEQNKIKLQDYKSVLDSFTVLNLFDEDLYLNEIDSPTDKLIELYAFYSDPKFFNDLIVHNIEFLQIKMYYDYIYLTIDNLNYGISCGSLNPQCPVMWGHYGNNHKGVCLKYEFEDNNLSLDNKKLLNILKVNYSDNPLDIFSYSTDQLEVLKFEIISRKYSKWNYEKEVRLVGQNQGLLKIQKGAIKEVIFGCKSLPKDRYSILKLLASLGYKINELKIAKRLPDQYELSIQPMTINDIAGSGVYMDELNLT